MLEHKFSLPDRLWLGQGCALTVGNRINANQFNRVFVVIDPIVYSTSFGKNIIESLKSCKEQVIWDSVETNNPRQHVEEASILLKRFRADVVVAVGGGSAIDLAKSALVLAVCGGSLEDYWQNKGIDSLPPIYAIPTTCGTGSEVSPYAVVLDPQTHRKRGIESEHIIPREAFLDPNSLDSLPSSLIGATGLDAFCHGLEAYVSAKSTSLTQVATLGTLIKIKEDILGAALDRKPDALETLMVCAATSRLLYPRTGLTIAHAMSHPLGAYFNLHHGDAVARVIVPSIRFNTEVDPFRYAELARLLSITDSDKDMFAVDRLLEWLEDLLAKLDLAQQELSAPHDIDNIVQKMAEATMSSSNIPSNPRPIGKDDIVKLFLSVFSL